jgi:gluconolactonase
MTRWTTSVLAILLIFLTAAIALSQGPASVSGIPGVVAQGEMVELVKEGFVFTEGPLGTADGGLFFSDIMGANRTYRLDSTGKIAVFREQTNGANGLALTRSAELLAAEGDSKRITRIRSDGTALVLTEGLPDAPLLAPNDLIMDSKGGIYFTDPGPRPVVPGRKAYVYYLPNGAKQPVILEDQIVRPNGLTLSNDGKTLIVDNTVGDTVYAFEVQSNGTIKNKRPFAHLVEIPPGQESGADGMALDRNDRLYVTTIRGVQVFDKAGRYLGTISVPRQPANVAFSGPNKRTLYITAREGLYRLRMLSQGPDRPGK